MEIKLKNTPEQVELIKAMGSKNSTVAREATEAIAAFLAPVIKKVLLTAGTASTVYRDVEFDEDSDPSIPLDLFYNEGAGYVTVWSQSQAGGMPTSQVEGMKEVKFGTYRLDSAVSFNKKYARKSRLDVVSKAIERMVNEVLTKQERNAWAVVLKALAEAYTPVYAGGQSVQAQYGHTIASTDTVGASSKFLLNDLNNLMVRIKRINESYAGNTPIQPYSNGITDLYVSPEVKANIRAFAYNPIATNQSVAAVTQAAVDTNWSATQYISDNLRDEIFKNAGLQSIYGVNVVELIELGIGQKYNNLFGTFAYSGNSASKVDGSAGGAAYSAGKWSSGASATDRQICVGIDNTRGAYVRPVAVQAESGGTFSVLPDGQFDMYGSRIQKVGFYGFLEEGRVCLDARSTVGIVLGAQS